ncbi:uncharacterized protein DUF937 [Chitinophaga skermanii]|uniref:Uncharacterized protein DUF937 n=1 Tax=Chitinophaga skermanii TaxID=331697 RepID=A0A327QTX3_9BACT|nr:OmpA family protein [Chitinophaga skermanii]RAJ06853.1 uncharacterized protein DUF937 [Chitinophaga skermanii]
MATDLLGSIENILGGDFASKAASQLGESKDGIIKAITAAIPAILTSFIHKASTAADPTMLTNIFKRADVQSAGNVSSLASEGISSNLISKGVDLVQSLLGDKAAPLVNNIANYAGIKASSAESVLHTTAPVAMNTLLQQGGGQGFNITNILAYLNTQKDKIFAAVPAGLGLSSILGVGNLSDIGHRFNGLIGGLKDNFGRAAASVTPSGTKKWGWMIILLVALAIILWYLMKGCGGSNTETVTVTDTMSATVVETPQEKIPVETPRESIKVSLPNGKTIDAYRGGIEDHLVQFLQDNSQKAGKDVWFDFDNLNFQTGSASITPESEVQVSNLAAILEAFPKAKIKIGGYTDRSGDSLANQKLSNERAQAVLAALKGKNVNPSQLQGAEGYGQQFAKAAADAPDDQRKLDRRISISVREK